MKTIVVSLLKGGVGKTFLATHLAWYLSEQGGNRVAFLDLDPQGSSTRRLASERTGWFSADLFDPEARLELTDAPGITVFAADPRLQMVKAAADVRDFLGRFPALGAHFDHCVIDTGPKWDELTLSAMAVADAVICVADDDALTRWMAAYPDTDTQRLRSLVRAARKDAAAAPEQRNGRGYRELFQRGDDRAVRPLRSSAHRGPSRAHFGEAHGEHARGRGRFEARAPRGDALGFEAWLCGLVDGDGGAEGEARGVQGRRARNEGRRRALMDLRAQKKDLQGDKRGSMYMAVESAATSGKKVIEAKHLTKKFGDRVIVEDFSTRIMRGDRVALVGPNGAGKTTLVRLLLGELELDAGTVQLGTNLEVSYIDQGRMALSDKITLWDFLTPGGGDSILVRGQPKHVAGYAKDFLFTEAQLRQPVTSLSGGERNRLLLARALANPTNLMVLDEPTNDLDMDTLDLLEDLLADFDGTLILVSHDRDFIDRLATSTIAMNGHGKVLETPGGWTDLIDQSPDFFKGARGASVGASFTPVARGAKAAAPAPAAAAPPPKKAGKLTFKDQRRLEECEALIAKSPAIIAGFEKILADPNLYSRDPATFDKTMKALDKARADLEQAEMEWLELEEKKENLAG